MGSGLQEDPRVDPRLKQAFGNVPVVRAPDVASRDELLRQEQSVEAQAGYSAMFAMMEAADREDIATFKGLFSSETQFRSMPDGNAIRMRVVRPESAQIVPCVYYIHGGGMQFLSCFNGTYKAWGRMIAAGQVAVAMVDFRNCVLPSTAPEVAPYPAGLNDCVSGLRWLYAQASTFGIDRERIILAGESGGANLAIATSMKLKRDGDLNKVSGVYALCPFICGEWPVPQYPSSEENNGLAGDWHNNRSRMAYGIEAFDAHDSLAWPGFATVEDVCGLPPFVISVNECDPFRDEGIEFYRLLLRANVQARCRQNMGMTHGAQVFPLGACLDVSRDTASHIAAFARENRVAEGV